MSTVQAAPVSAASGDGGWLTIGEVARSFSVSQRALRFYEDRGLLAPRREGMARLYGAGDRRRLASILRAKRLGFTLAEIEGILAGDGPGGEGLVLDRQQVAQQIAHLERRREGIDAALAELRAAQRQMSEGAP